MHGVKRLTPRGEFWIKVYCKLQDGQPCEHCANGVSSSPLFFLWAYVYEIMHRQQNPKLASNPDAEKWERLVVKDMSYFKEVVNGPMVFRTGPGKDQKYRNMLINFADEYGTLCDRDYKWIRTGATKDTTDYSLLPKDPKKITKEVATVKKDLLDLGDVISGKAKQQTSIDSTKSETPDNDSSDDKEEEFF
jgi:hypothetical protein